MHRDDRINIRFEDIDRYKLNKDFDEIFKDVVWILL